MAIAPTVGCRNQRAALALHTTLLDFDRVEGDDTPGDPGNDVLARDGDRLILSPHRGDGAAWRVWRPREFCRQYN